MGRSWSNVVPARGDTTFAEQQLGELVLESVEVGGADHVGGSGPGQVDRGPVGPPDSGRGRAFSKPSRPTRRIRSLMAESGIFSPLTSTGRRMLAHTVRQGS